MMNETAGTSPGSVLHPSIDVSVIMRLREIDNRWVAAVWEPVEVIPAQANWTCSRHEARCDGLAIGLFRDEAENYYLNISAQAPVIFVHWRAMEMDAAGDLPEVVDVTVSYGEAARWLDSGESVDPVPMPEPVLAWVAEFVALHYRPEPKRKKRVQSFLRPEERDI